MIYCGVDGGGTKTKIIIADDSKVLMTVTVGPTSIDTVSTEELKKTISKGLNEIYQKVDIPKIDSIFLGLGGISSQEHSILVNDQIRTLPFISDNAVVKSDNDIKNAFLASCSGRNNITIIVGTGAVAYGIDERGTSHRTNGIHYLEGDFGGAYDVGVRALKRMTKAFDSRIPHSSLTKDLLESFSVKTRTDIVTFLEKNRLNRTFIAQIAKKVTKHAEKQDPHAMEILEEATDEMLQSIIGVDKNILLNNKEIGVVGSLGNTTEYFKRLEYKLTSYNNSYRIHKTELDPVEGSLIEAKRQVKATL